MHYSKDHLLPGKRYLLRAAILLLFLGLAACAARSDSPEPKVTVRGQYDITIGTIKR
jgi:hypothetical protein